MMRWSRICKGIGLSLLIFTLGGCAKETATVNEVMEEIKTTEQKDTEDMTLGLDDIILQVGDTSVTYREVLFYIYKAKAQYEDELGSDVWDVALENGNSFEDYAKEELLREITEIKVIGQEAKKEDVTLTAEEEAQAENEAAAFLETVTDEEKEEYGFETELLKDIYMDHAIANKMYEKTVEDAKVVENENVEKSTAEKVKEAKEQQESEVFQEAYTKWSEEYSAKVSVKLWQEIQVKES